MMKKTKADPKVTWSIAARPADVPHVSTTKTLLVGSTVFASSRDISIPGYAKLAPRHGVGVLASILTKESPRIYIGVSDVVMNQAPRGARFALAMDGYVQWGLRSRGKVVLIGGCDSPTESSLDVLIFENGRFIDYANKVLPGTSANHYAETVADLLDEFAASHPGHNVVQAAPLTPFGNAFPNVQYVGDKIFRRLAFRPLSQKAGARYHNLSIPLGIVAASALVYLGAIGKGWAEYSAAKQAFSHEIADPLVKGKGGVDSALIDVTQQRRFFLNEPRRQVALAEMSGALVAGIGKIEGLRIVEITLTAPGASVGATGVEPTHAGPAPTAEATPDVLLRVSVPNRGEGAMVQGKAVMMAISANTGMSARLARQGWTDDGKRRVFNIEGFIHG
jgi:hypothetical protein